MDTLTLVLPGALVPPDWLRDAQWTAQVDAAAASARLARADAVPRPADAPACDGNGPAGAPTARALPHERWLAWRFGLADAASWHAVSAHADGWRQAHWRLDPVGLNVGIDRITLAALPGARLAEPRAQALAEAIAPVLNEHGLALHRGPSGRWYASAGHAWRLSTGTPAAALGRRIDAYLPEGPDALRWRRLVTEVEMTWHALAAQADVAGRADAPGRAGAGGQAGDAADRQAGILVNSLWLSGPVPVAGAGAGADAGAGGSAGAGMGASAGASASAGAGAGAPHDALFGPDVSLRGVAALHGVPHADAFDPAAVGRRALVLDDALLRSRLASDPAAWAEAWQALASGVLAHALAALDEGRAGTLEVVGTGESDVAVLRLRRADRWQPWRRLRAGSLAARWARDGQAAP